MCSLDPVQIKAETEKRSPSRNPSLIGTTRMDLPQRVIALVAEEVEVPPTHLSPETTLYGDLGTDGDDGAELL